MSTLELTYRSFIDRISGVSKKDIILKLYRSFIITLSVFLLLALILTSAEALYFFTSAVRKFFLYGFTSALAATVLIILIIALSAYRSLQESKSINRYALRIGDNFPSVKDNLLNAIQLYHSTRSRDKFFSESLAEESIRQVDGTTKNLNFNGIISYKSNNSFLMLFAGILLVFVSLFMIFPGVFQASAFRLINYNYKFVDNTLGISYDVKPGNIEIARGDNVNISVRVHFNNPVYAADKITFNTKLTSIDGADLSSSSQDLSAVKWNEFNTVVSNISSSTSYWFEYKGIKSDEYTITVTNRPIIKSVKITIFPPAYTKLPSHDAEGNNITTIMGSKVYVELESPDNLSSSVLQFSDGSPLDLSLNGNSATGSFTANRNETFKLIAVKNSAGRELTNVNPPGYSLKVYPDEYPKAEIIEPESELQMKGDKDVLVRSRITDDFGFTKMRLGYRLSKSKYGMTNKDFNFADIPIKNLDATALEVPYEWNLSNLNLGTEDEVEYFVEVYDNDAVSGPKSTRSDVHKLIYPSLESLLKKTEETSEDIANSLKSSYENAMDLKQELNNIQDKLKKDPEDLGLNDPKKNQELQNKINDIQNQFSSTQQKLNELMTSLQNNNQISKETMDKYMELQKMFQQIDSKELREMMQKLQEALKNLDPQKLQEAMKDFTFDEERFKKAIEKTMELLKKILNEQKFGELAKKLDEMAKKQEELKNKTENTDEKDKNQMNQLSSTQEQLKKEYEEFLKQMKELSDNMKQLNNDEIAKQFEKMMKEMQKKNLDQKMNQSSKDLQSGNKDNSMDQQQQLSEDLNEMNQQMQDLLNQMMQNENSKLMAKMQELLDKMQKMSQEQGELKDQSGKMDENTDESEYKENESQQKGLTTELQKTIDELMQLSDQMPMTPQLGKLLGDAYNEMSKASKSLGKKDAKSANTSQGKAKESLDKAIEKFKSMCQNGKMPGKGNSLSQLLQALQQMIARQQALNDKMSRFGPNGNKGQYTQQELAEMQKLSMEQETIRKNLQQLNDEFKKQQEVEGKKLLGNLDQVQKDMMEIITDLKDNNITPETRKRQEKILSRMLDFQLSVREKDFEQKRESRPGKDYDRTSPPEIVISRPNVINGINQDALKLQSESFNEDYEILIQKYLSKLNAENKK